MKTYTNIQIDTNITNEEQKLRQSNSSNLPILTLQLIKQLNSTIIKQIYFGHIKYLTHRRICS